MAIGAMIAPRFHVRHSKWIALGVSDLNGYRLSSLASAFTLLLAACSSSVNEAHEQSDGRKEISELRSLPVIAVTPQEVAEAFALGSSHTDVQREILSEKIIGHVVDWDLNVYEVSFDDGVYTITTQPISIRSRDALPLIRVSARVLPSTDRDVKTLQQLETNDPIRLKGMVNAIMIRTIVQLDPTIIIPYKSINSKKENN